MFIALQKAIQRSGTASSFCDGRLVPPVVRPTTAAIGGGPVPCPGRAGAFPRWQNLGGGALLLGGGGFVPFTSG